MTSIIFSGSFMSLKSNLFEKSVSGFVILVVLKSARRKYLSKYSVKHFSSSVF